MRRRKKIKHYAVDGESRALTFSCYQRAAVFADPENCRILTRWINAALSTLPYDLLAFVYMPDHVHLLVLPRNDGSDIDRLLWRIKKPSSLSIHDRLVASGQYEMLATLRYVDPKGEPRFRLWQAGPGYDRNLERAHSISQMIEYIHGNPVRKELCACPDEYQWSSWRQIHAPGADDPEVPKVNWPDDLIL